jgi:hypothetical protein
MLGLFGTFWADFTMRADRQIGWIFALLSLAAGVGLARRALRREWPAANIPGLAAAGLALGLMAAMVLSYSLTIYEIPGRLFFPALATISLMLALGLSAWRGRVGRWVGWGAAAVLLLIDLLAPVLILGPAYARPVVASGALPIGTLSTSVRFGSAVELIGYRFQADSVTPGQPVRVWLYWKTQAPLPRQIPDAFARVTLKQPDGQVIGETMARLGTTVYPCSEWCEGELVETQVSVTPTGVTEPTVAMAEVGVVKEGTSQWLPTAQGETAQLGRVAIRSKSPQRCSPKQTLNRMFGDSIRLTGYSLESGRLVLCWQALQPVPDDYTVFIHLFDDGGQAVAAADGPPRSGNYPTSAWLPDETVEDAHVLPAWDQGYLTLGLYRLDTGERLGLDGTAETEIKIAP